MATPDSVSKKGDRHRPGRQMREESPGAPEPVPVFQQSAKRPAQDDSGRFAYEGLERVMHEKARLGILTSLVAHADGLLFGDLKELCALTDGNLNRHLKVLQEAQLVEVWKGFNRNRPQTLCRITADGRARFLEYLNTLEQVIADAADAAKVVKPATPAMLKGWSPA